MLRVLSDRDRRPARFLLLGTLQDLGLESIDVVHTGRDTYPLSPRIRALAISRLTTELGRARRAGRR